MDLHLDTAFYGDLDQVPGNQNVSSPYTELFWVQASVEYRNLRSSLGHVDDEKGIVWQLAVANDYVNGESVPSATPSSISALRCPCATPDLAAQLGRLPMGTENPFANFYFGGSVTTGSTLWPSSAAGVRPVPGSRSTGQGRHLRQDDARVEPAAARFESVGWPGFHLTWARTAVFAGGLVTDSTTEACAGEVATSGPRSTSASWSCRGCR
jgi:hypothetical protein